MNAMESQLQPIVSLDGICKSHFLEDRELPILINVNLSFSQGDFAAIMGPSGSGKSTLLYLIGCLDIPTRGRYLLTGKDVATLSDGELSLLRGKTIGFVFQAFHLIPNMTILANVMLPMSYQNVSPKEQRERATYWLNKVGLSHRMEHRPRQMSGGENQRAAIARALVNNPQLLLADEPTGNLDSTREQEILDLLIEIQQDLHTTIIMVTHSDKVASVAKRILRMKDGRLSDAA